jgi:hypothetical protein
VSLLSGSGKGIVADYGDVTGSMAFEEGLLT